MKAAIDDTSRRRLKQIAFNKENNITPVGIKKRIKDMKDRKAKGKNFSAKNLKELEAKLAAN